MYLLFELVVGIREELFLYLLYGLFLCTSYVYKYYSFVVAICTSYMY